MQVPGSVNNLPNLSKANEMAEEESSIGKIDVERLLPILNKSLGWIILFIIFSAAAGYLYLRSTRPIYESNSVLRLDVKSRASKVLGDRLGTIDEELSEANSQNSLQAEIELIRSPVIYNEVLTKLPLDVSYYQFGKFLYTELYTGTPFKVNYVVIDQRFYDTEVDVEFVSDKEFILQYRLGGEKINNRFNVGQIYKNKHIEFQIEKTAFFKPNAIGPKFFFTINSKEAMIRLLENNLKAKPLNAQAGTIQITFNDYTPQKAQDIVNQVDTIYKIKTLEKKQQSSRQTLDFIRNQLDSTKILLDKSERELEVFLKSSRTVDPKSQIGNVVSQITLAIKERSALEQRLGQVKEIRSEVLSERNTERYIPALSIVAEPEVMRLVAALNELNVNSKRAKQSIKSSESIASKNIKSTYESSRQNALTLLDAFEKLLSSEIAGINSDISKFENQIGLLPNQETQINRIKRNLTVNEEFYLLLKQKEAEYGIAKAGMVPDFQILQPANLPAIAISPQKGTVYTLWIIIGIIAGIVLVFVRYVLQDTVSTVKEVEKNTVAPLLGVIPVYTKEKLRVARMVVDKNPKSSLSEAMRAIRTNIEFVASQDNKGKKRIISITSTVAGEGKTFVAINLSAILAMSKQRVVLLDLDMRKPKLHLAFDLANDKGMSSILSGKCQWKEAIYHTPLEDIDVIPAGPPPPNPAELLMRPVFDQLLRELHEEYDIIFIDCPPVGLVTDGIIVMQKADLPIYVVRSEYSKRIYLKNVNKLVRANGFKSLGIVLNGLDKLKTYGYGYGYGYDYYTDDDVPQGFDANWIKTLLGLKG